MVLKFLFDKNLIFKFVQLIKNSNGDSYYLKCLLDKFFFNLHSKYFKKIKLKKKCSPTPTNDLLMP